MESIRSLLVAICFFCASYIAVYSSSASSTDVSLDPETHKAFLLNNWLPYRPSVAIFVDPLCPYCKKAMPTYRSIQSYNVFAFWSPIFGQRSESVIGPLFQCQNPTSIPIMEALAVSAFSAPMGACDNSLEEARQLRELNDQIVSQFNINAVPSYYIAGEKVVSDKIFQVDKNYLTNVQGILIDWRRYEENRVTSLEKATFKAVLIIGKVSRKTIRQVTELMPEYVFAQTIKSKQCKKIGFTDCRREFQSGLAKIRYSSEELIALLDASSFSNGVYQLDFDGNLTKL